MKTVEIRKFLEDPHSRQAYNWGEISAEYALTLLSALEASREENRRMLEALKLALPELKQTLDDIGACDHSVNICHCDLIRAIEAVSAALNKARIE